MGEWEERSDLQKTVESFYALIAARDPAALEELIDDTFAPDVVFRAPESLPHGGATRGIDALKRLFLAAASPDMKFGASNLMVVRVAEAARGGEHHVIVELAFDWLTPTAEAPVASGAVEWWRFADLRVQELKVFYWDTVALTR